MTAPTQAWEQTGTIPQRTTRMAQGGLLGRPTAVFAGGVLPTTGGGSHGVVGTNDLTPSGTTLTIAFTVGGCFINGMSSIAQGAYYWYNDVAGATITLAAYNAQPRIDLVGVWLKDAAEDSSGATTCGFDKVTGTASGSPAVPAAPAGFLVLGQVAVPATSGATTVTPKKTYAAGIGGRIRCTSTTRPTGVALWQGQEINELDTKRFLTYDGSAWIPMGSYGAYTAANAILIAQGVTGLTNTYRVVYNQIGKQVNAKIEVVITSAGVAGGEIFINTSGLPQIRATSSCAGTFHYNDTGTAFYTGTATMDTSGKVAMVVSGSGGGLGLSPSFAAANGDTFEMNLLYEAA